MAGKKDKAELHDYFDSSFDATRYTAAGTVEVGPNLPRGPKGNLYYLDGSDAYANLRKMVISIQHVPSGRSVYFKAFITTFVETFSPQWQEEPVYGRPDPIFLYKNTGRAFAMAYTIPASNAHEAYENLGKVQTLTKFLYPNYERVGEAQTISQSPLLRLKVMNIARRDRRVWTAEGVLQTKKPNNLYKAYRSDPASNEGLLGVLGTLTIDHHLQDVGGFVHSSNTILPKQIDLTFDFKVIHEHPVGWDAKNNFGAEGGHELFPYGVRLDDPFAKFAAKHPTTTTVKQLQADFAQDKEDQAKAQAKLEAQMAAHQRFKKTSAKRAGRMLKREGKRELRGGLDRFSDIEQAVLAETFVDLPSEGDGS